MTVRREQYFHNGLYFITFTCYKWLPLFQLINGYTLVYNWFDVLVKAGSYIVGYVIMPNHLHALLAFREHPQSVNKRTGNGKRFMAYGLVDLLKQTNNGTMLQTLANGVNKTDRSRGKLHQVFMASFDCKECFDTGFIIQKLEYIHNNPYKGKWNLADCPENYFHSSARFYTTGSSHSYKHLTNYSALEDVNLAEPEPNKGAGVLRRV